MRRLVAIPAATVCALLAACGDTPSPAEPFSAAPTGLRMSAASTPTSGAATLMLADLDDISTRFLPAFEDAAAAGRVGTLVNELKTHVSASNRIEALRVIALIRAQLTDGVANPVDVEVVKLTLAFIEAKL
jgi:hypothetical protein